MSFQFDRLEVADEKPRSGYSLAYKRRQQMALDSVQDIARPGERVLDIAAGQGNFTLMLAESGYRVTWNDIREDLAGYARLKHEHGEVDFLPGNIYDIEPDAPFDVVLMTEVIEHVAHPDLFLARAAELVRPGGHIVVTTPNGEYWRNNLPRFSDHEDPSQFESVQFRPDADGHIFLLHVDEMYSLAAAAGLEVLRMTVFTNSLTNGHVKLEPLLQVVPGRIVGALERLTTSDSLGHLRRRLNVQISATLRRPGPGG